MGMLLTRKQVAERYHREPRTITRWCNDPNDPRFKLGFPQPQMHDRWPMWDLDELDAWDASRPKRHKPTITTLADLDLDDLPLQEAAE